MTVRESVVSLPVLPQTWLIEAKSATTRAATVTVQGPGMDPVTVRLQRCIHGRLRDAYPVSGHDLELVVDAQDPAVCASILDVVPAALLAADERCRRVVFAVALDLPEAADVELAAVGAGFRPVVDVDLPGASVRLMVREPRWVTEVDIDLDTVPGS